MAAKTTKILSNRASPCGVQPSTPHSSGFRLPAHSRFGEGRGALHLALFEQPGKDDFFSSLLIFLSHIDWTLCLVEKEENSKKRR